MTNDTHHSFRSRVQMPLVVLSLLVLLLAFLSSVTHQHFVETRLNHGFVSSLDHLVVASHSEVLREQPNASAKDGAADNGPDTPQWWSDGPAVFGAGRRQTDSVARAGLDAALSTVRFLTPLLRAPPLA